MNRAREPGDPIPSALIREFRKRDGLSQDELAKRLGLAGKAVVSGWETGRTKCEGPAAEFLLHLYGRGNAALEVPALTRSMDDIWERTGNSITSWRQVTAIPEGQTDITQESFANLFPAASLPIDQVQHGFPFTGEDLPTRVCGITSKGWLGCIPFPSDQQPRYLWMLTRDGRFAYREALWEEHPTSMTRGHFDIATIALVSLQTTFFLKRLAQQLSLDDNLGFTMQLDLRGASGKGIVDGSNTLSPAGFGHTNSWAENSADATISTDVIHLRDDPLKLGLELAAELCMQVNVNLATPKVLQKIIRSQAAGSRQLGFL